MLTIPSLISVVASAQAIIWQGKIEIAEGSGERGPWRQNESRYNYVDDPAVAIDDHGSIAVAWVNQAQKDVLFQRIDANGAVQLSRAVNVSRNGATFSWLPRIAFAHETSNKIYVLWQEIIFSGGSHGGDILFARSENGGRTFEEPLNLSRSLGGDGKGRINADVWHNGSLDIAVGDEGKLYAAWSEYEGMLWFARSSDGGRRFSRPVRLAGGGEDKPARAPSLAIDEKGHIYLAWTVGEDESADIRVAKSADGGATFSRPRIVHSSKGYSDAPKLVVGAKESLHMVYAESDGGPFGRYHIRYTHSENGSLDFSAPRELTKLSPVSLASAAYPALSIDAKGRLYVLWEVFQNYLRRPRGLALIVSSDGGKTFTLPRQVPESADPSGGSNGSHQGFLTKKLAVNRAGSVAIVNSSLKENERSRVWLVRGRT